MNTLHIVNGDIEPISLENINTIEEERRFLVPISGKENSFVLYDIVNILNGISNSMNNIDIIEIQEPTTRSTIAAITIVECYQKAQSLNKYEDIQTALKDFNKTKPENFEELLDWFSPFEQIKYY